MKDYYAEIDKALLALERYKYAAHNIDWICYRIDWCWKWRKITEAQRDELCDRAINIMKGDIK